MRMYIPVLKLGCRKMTQQRYSARLDVETFTDSSSSRLSNVKNYSTDNNGYLQKQHDSQSTVDTSKVSHMPNFDRREKIRSACFDRDNTRGGNRTCQDATYPQSEFRQPVHFSNEAGHFNDDGQNVRHFPTDRRRTWSPPPQPIRMKVREESAEFSRRCYSNEPLDFVEDDLEDVEERSPPRIIPVSGKLTAAEDHLMIRPIAYKPVTPSLRSCLLSCSPFSSRKVYPTSQSQDEGYNSRDLQNLSSSSSSSAGTSRSSCSHAADTSSESGTSELLPSKDLVFFITSHDVDATKERCRVKEIDMENGLTSSRLSRRSSRSRRSMSPSDSGIEELEAVLREKDLELERLRERMAANESAMLQVFEERRRQWELEMTTKCQRWELKLRSQQQKSFRTEQSLLLQIFKLQKDNKVLRQGMEKVKKTSCDGDQHELQATKERLEESLWEQGQKNGEIALLKAQLKSTKEETTARSMELASARIQLKEAQAKSEIKEAEIRKLVSEQSTSADQCRVPEESSSSIESQPASDSSSVKRERLMLAELSRARSELNELKARIDSERAQWLSEKIKVINYQKRLQLNYAQIARKNRVLEAEVQQLSVELEMQELHENAPVPSESFC